MLRLPADVSTESRTDLLDEFEDLCIMLIAMRGGAVAARRAHNPKVGGSNPPPATLGAR